MKDKKRYSEAFKLKVMEELRDCKWKSATEAAKAYGLSEVTVYNWMHKLGFEHLKGRLIYVKTKTEADRTKDITGCNIHATTTMIFRQNASI